MDQNRTLSGQVLQTAALFQAIVAFPVTLVLGSMAFSDFFGPYLLFFDFMFVFLFNLSLNPMAVYGLT